MMGSVTLVGAGPGDPGLLTVKGEQALRRAEVVVYDRLVSPEILQRIPPEAEKIDVGKESGCHPVPQARINEILRKQAQAGKRVVRLKGGDPFLFGRGAGGWGQEPGNPDRRRSLRVIGPAGLV